MPVIHVAMACDEAYALPLSVTVRSLLAGLSGDCLLHVHILCSDLLSAVRERVAAAMPDERVILSWYEIESRSLPATLPVWDFHHANIVSFYRLLLPVVLPADLDRVLYLDSDLLMKGDVSTLWEMDLGNCLLAAVAEQMPTTRFASSKEGLSLWQDLGFAADHALFNAGVMLINLDAWRAGFLSDRAFDYLAMAGAAVQWQDQEALNVVVRDNWLPLEGRWNLAVQPFNRVRLDAFRLNSDSEGCILHYLSDHKPWHSGYRGPCAGLYRDQLHKAITASGFPVSSWGLVNPDRATGRRVIARINKAVRKRRRRIALIIDRLRYRLLRTRLHYRTPRFSGVVPPHLTGAAEIRVVLLPLQRTRREAGDSSLESAALAAQGRNLLDHGADRVLLVSDDANSNRRLAAAAESSPDVDDPASRLHIIPRDPVLPLDTQLRWLLNHHGCGHWCIVLYQNETLYTDSAGPLDLRALVQRLQQEQATGLIARHAGVGSDDDEGRLSCDAYDKDTVLGRLFQTEREFRITATRPAHPDPAHDQTRGSEVQTVSNALHLSASSLSVLAVFRYERSLFLGPACRTAGGVRLASFTGVLKRRLPPPG